MKRREPLLLKVENMEGAQALVSVEGVSLKPAAPEALAALRALGQAVRDLAACGAKRIQADVFRRD